MRMTIVEAVLAILKDSGKPMTAPEITREISARHLYEFKAKQPAQIVLQQIRRHCVGVDNRLSSKVKLFERSGTERFVALPAAIQPS